MIEKCEWAPVVHVADAAYWVLILRPCGHPPNGDGTSMAASCVECTARVRATDPEWVRATECPDCGETSRPFIVAVWDLDEVSA